PPRRRARALGVEVDALRLHLLLEVDLGLVARVVDLDLGAVLLLDRELVLRRAEDRRLDVRRMLLDELVDARERRLLRAALVRDQRLARQVDEQHDHDQGEKRATEEAIHLGSPTRVPGSIPSAYS